MDLLRDIQIKKLDIQHLDTITMFHVKHCNEYKITKDEFLTFLSKDQYCIYAAFDGQLVIGYIIYLRSIDMADIVYIFVQKEYRNIGVASLLLQISCTELSVEQLFLEVSFQNKTAINFYTKNNFKTINIRKNYYKNSDAFVMCLCNQ
ncbi:MAG: GNAT family N-acetyltransferase [Alphaproteobacteria bacterium]|nr:GNAT family N-acetyltransferase [Alphaproteobacteria bacterium]